MESYAITNKDKDYSNNSLKNSQMEQPYNSPIIYNLNNTENNNDRNPNSSKINLTEEENNIQPNIPFNNYGIDSQISQNKNNNFKYYKEKIKIDNNKIPNVSSDTKLNNSEIIKNPLQEYLQKGYKKYPHSKIDRELIQRYEFWEGSQYFPYGGHILEGPCSFRPTMATGLAVVIPIGLFIIFDGKYITENWTISILIIGGIICLIVLIFLILCSFRDPGILRRFYLNYNFRFDRKNIKIFQLGHIFNYKYCGTCSIMRPLRSSHCFDCNTCVERCDHHCPWVGNCVGKRNYIFFYLFIFSFTFMLIYIEAFCIAHISTFLYDKINKNNDRFNSKKRAHIVAYSLCDTTMSLFLIIYCAVCLAFTLGLLIYHTYLIIINTTTKEILKLIWKNSFGNPFNRYLDYNLNNVLFPQTKKYSILDILRNGKKPSESEKKERLQWAFRQHNFYHINSNYNDMNNNYNDMNNNYNDMNNNYNDMNNNNNDMNNNNNPPLSKENKSKKNIDPNQDINEAIKKKINYENNYKDTDDKTITTNNVLN